MTDTDTEADLEIRHQVARSIEFAHQLRELAAFIERHPEYAPWLRHTLEWNLHLNPENRLYCTLPDLPAELARLQSVVETEGGTYHDRGSVSDEDQFTRVDVILPFGLKLRLLLWREEVCQRKLVGTRTVTRTIPDPDAPEIEVTEDVPIYEWECNE